MTSLGKLARAAQINDERVSLMVREDLGEAGKRLVKTETPESTSNSRKPPPVTTKLTPFFFEILGFLEKHPPLETKERCFTIVEMKPKNLEGSASYRYLFVKGQPGERFEGKLVFPWKFYDSRTENPPGRATAKAAIEAAKEAGCEWQYQGTLPYHSDDTEAQIAGGKEKAIHVENRFCYGEFLRQHQGQLEGNWLGADEIAKRKEEIDELSLAALSSYQTWA